jgi:hypothetical protein
MSPLFPNGRIMHRKGELISEKPNGRGCDVRELAVIIGLPITRAPREFIVEHGHHPPHGPLRRGVASPTPVDDRALWLWGRLKDFERLGVLDAEPDDLLATMLDHIGETVCELAPVVAAWLERIRTRRCCAPGDRVW